MTSTDKLPPLPMRTVSVALPDEWLDRLDTLRRDDPDLASRSELIRQAVGLFLHLHELPAEVFGALIDGCAALQDVLVGDDETPAASIGEPQGHA